MTDINVEKKMVENENYLVSESFERCDGQKYYAVCKVNGHYCGCTEYEDEHYDFWVEFYPENIELHHAIADADCVALEDLYAADLEEIRTSIQKFISGEIKTFSEEREEKKKKEAAKDAEELRQAQEDLARLGSREFARSVLEGRGARAELVLGVFEESMDKLGFIQDNLQEIQDALEAGSCVAASDGSPASWQEIQEGLQSLEYIKMSLEDILDTKRGKK